MSDIAVRIEGLGKEYHIGGKQEKYRTLRDSLTDMVIAPVRRTAQLLRGQAYGASNLTTSMWALQDVSFQVKQGEAVAIIGRNGAGKSTLLKILSRITEPTRGYAEVYGRVGALLEVGTGFHPELTGRENIYLNGTILGMKRSEIDRKFDEIVDFAEMERFIDTPVKHYSSGMGLRLGFAVAAHLEPEILVIDEVLAVGDQAFQKKCLGKMGDITGQGRTILFVSHNMASVLNLCTQGILLDKGTVQQVGDVRSVVESYINQQMSGEASGDLVHHSGRPKNRKQVMRSVQLMADNETLTSVFYPSQKMSIVVNASLDEISDVSLGFAIKDSVGNRVFATNMAQYGQIVSTNHKREISIRVSIDQLPFSPGIYMLDLFLGNGSFEYDIVLDAVSFEIVWEKETGLEFPPKSDWGPLFIPVVWEHELHG
jgi:lipopolysaccharide transport system ATP-binding protein